MAKTLTISDINISSIVVGIVLNLEGKPVGFSSNISYSIVDPDGVHLMQKNTTKYTSGTDQNFEIIKKDCKFPNSLVPNASNLEDVFKSWEESGLTPTEISEEDLISEIKIEAGLHNGKLNWNVEKADGIRALGLKSICRILADINQQQDHQTQRLQFSWKIIKFRWHTITNR